MRNGPGKFSYNNILVLFFLFSFTTSHTLIAAESCQSAPSDKPVLKNPVNVDYLRKHLRKDLPRLVLNSEIEKELSRKLKTDPVTRNMYSAIKLNSSEILTKPFLQRKMDGKRLLGVSREMLYRMNMLGMVYRIEKDREILSRINDELIAVCNFSDWNPSHFLDVAEMSMAVAIAIDWTANKLPKSTIELAKTALIEKGINPSYDESSKANTGWIKGNSNWNQVCHGGMIAAAISISEKDPELAARTISRALKYIPNALDEYGPDGAYPEGASYWDYGTSFSVMSAAMLESAFGTDFGMADYPAFMKTAVFKALCNAPSGMYYNYADCSDSRSKNGDIILAWFASKTGITTFFERERFLLPPSQMGKLSRLSGAGLVWVSQYTLLNESSLPTAWKGGGANPVVFFTGGKNDNFQYYFGGKGGSGTVNHGNMDGGSFIFELNGVRWVIDPGMQSYTELEESGFDLWGKCQDCDRWKLLTKNNFGHSTLTVNNQLHVVNGKTEITEFLEGDSPRITFDMSPAFGNNMKSVKRKFIKDSPLSLIVQDELEINHKTELITWQLLTTAVVEIIPGGAILKQDGKQLRIQNLSHPTLTFSVISLNPAPHKFDRSIDNLKRLELHIPAWYIKKEMETITIRLTGE